jgi:hypothetical protein
MPTRAAAGVHPAEALRLSVLWGDRVLEVCTLPEGGGPWRAPPGSLAALALSESGAGEPSWRLGGLEARLEPVRPVAGLHSPLHARLDTAFLNVLLLALFSAVALLATFHLRPARSAQTEQDLHRVPPRAIAFLLSHRSAAQAAVPLRDRLDEPEPAAAPRARGPEGAAGRPDRPAAARRISIRRAKPGQETPRPGGRAALTFGPMAGNGFSGPLAGPPLGRDLEEALGDLHAPLPGDSGGLLGAGKQGTGPGGGGRDDLVLLGRLPTSGTFREGLPDGPPGRSRKPPQESQVRIAVGEPIIHGPLSMDAIRTVVHAHRAQLRYCYNQALTRQPDLAGKLVMRFVIAESGYVASARVEGGDLSQPELAACVRDRMLTWRFPAPRGGGEVTVSYPFVFRRPR